MKILVLLVALIACAPSASATLALTPKDPSNPYSIAYNSLDVTTTTPYGPTTPVGYGAVLRAP